MNPAIQVLIILALTAIALGLWAVSLQLSRFIRTLDKIHYKYHMLVVQQLRVEEDEEDEQEDEEWWKSSPN